jgi:hypothetical protein
MIMDAAMIANAFPLMPQRHPAATAVLSFDLKDMRLLPPLVIRADERRRTKRSDRVSRDQTATWPWVRAGVASSLDYTLDRR